MALYISNGRSKRELSQKAQGKTVVHLYTKSLSILKVYVPSKTEQLSIANIFKQLNHIITLHQRKLDLLMNIKQSLLSRMFV